MEQIWTNVRLRDPKEEVSIDAPKPAMAMAPGRGLREDQLKATLPLARGRSRRRSPGTLRDQTPGSQGGITIPEESHETVWQPRGDRD